MPTIYEVAALAGVSPATVSRVLNGVPVSPAYAAKVRQAAEALNFTPNRTARTLRRRSSEIIALIIPDIENPFFTALARGVEDSAQAAGYSVVLCNTDERQDKEAKYLKIALSEHMAGVILAPTSNHTNLDAVVSRKTPVVAVDRSAHGYTVTTRCWWTTRPAAGWRPGSSTSRSFLVSPASRARPTWRRPKNERRAGVRSSPPITSTQPPTSTFASRTTASTVATRPWRT